MIMKKEYIAPRIVVVNSLANNQICSTSFDLADDYAGNNDQLVKEDWDLGEVFDDIW